MGRKAEDQEFNPFALKIDICEELPVGNLPAWERQVGPPSVEEDPAGMVVFCGCLDSVLLCDAPAGHPPTPWGPAKPGFLFGC